MVKLYVSKLGQVGMLETAIIASGIELLIEEVDCAFGIPPPVLEVDGVPLDEERAWKWVRTLGENSQE